MLAKSCVLCCVSHDGDGDTAREHAQWHYLVASHEVTNTLHRSMCLASYLPGGKVVAIAVESATLYYIVD